MAAVDKDNAMDTASDDGVDKQIVMIAIDGSNQAEYAFEYYAANLHVDTHDVLLVHIAEPPMPPIGRFLDKASFDRDVDETQKQVKILEDKFGDKMAKKEIKGRIVAIFSNKPGETLCKVASREHCSLVVLGTRGLGVVRRTFLGSVSNYVLHHAHCPVCICPPL